METDTGISGHKPITAQEARDEKKVALGSNETAPVNENRASLNDHDHDPKSDTEESEEGAINDLFVSLPPIKDVPIEENPLTVRAVLVGIVLGSLCNASNVYLGTFWPRRSLILQKELC